MRKLRPTNTELQILKVLWDHGPLNVRAIHARMDPAQRTGYTTLSKLLQAMLEKKLVQREVTARSHIYRARVKEQQTQRQLLRDLIQGAFGGLAQRHILQALLSKRTTRSEVAETKKLLKKKK